MIASLASVKSAAVAVPILLAGFTAAAESPYKVDTRDNILKAAKTLAEDLIALYPGDEPGSIPGLLPGPPPEGDYYWWQGGALMQTYLDYYRRTGDDTYNDIITKGILHQVGPNNDFLPPNQTATITNDDQCTWASAALLAAEMKLPDPAEGPKWFDLAKNAYDEMADPVRNDDTCGGGLRWAIPPINVGYDYKNTMANGCFLDLAGRMAKFTGNITYVNATVASTWDWLITSGLLDEESYAVYDGAHTGENCTDVNKAQFSLPAVYILHGLAYAYNATGGADIWRNRLTSLTEYTLNFFFPDDVAFERACEISQERCTNDMRSFKGVVHRYLADATIVAPFLAESVLPVLKKSAEAAVKTCTGGDSGRECSFYWSEETYVAPEVPSGSEGTVHNAGEQMNVLAAVASLLDVTVTGGTGTGNGNENGTETDSTGGASTTTPPSGSAAGRVDVQMLGAVVVGLGAWLFVGA